MNPKNTAKLLQDFPELFRDSDQTCLCRGFEVGDGWFELIYALCRNIEQEALKDGLSKCSDDWPRVDQVKSKFGTLRFYILNRRHHPPMSEAIRQLIAEAVEQSATIREELE